MSQLKSPYLQIQRKQMKSYGGNQAWLPYRFLQKVGCGVISAADLLLYLQKTTMISEEEYLNFTKKLWTNYLPVIPGFGMNGLTLMLGLNRYFIQHKIPYRACWKLSGKRMLGRIDRMLYNDIPVILSIGPNFPFFWGKHKLNFYMKSDTGAYIPAVKTKAHFVNVTGRDGVWLRISSWGKEYYIDLREYKEYVRAVSHPLVSNIVGITCVKQS